MDIAPDYVLRVTGYGKEVKEELAEKMRIPQ
jgi:hypothetical protein